ncbi:MAG: hypothetical protein JRF53_00485 [Deltaproteobacteria bacterium]|nr:hypothetical protein [Deltaproteobacteria bacterium]
MKPILRLIRLEERTKYGTFGVLLISEEVFCVTLEPPDMENVAGRSSIPAQQYTCIRHNSPRFGETFKIINVPGRKNILFHPGNLLPDTAGCIVLGQHFGRLQGNRGVLASGKTFTTFMKILRGYDICRLTIREVY